MKTKKCLEIYHRYWDATVGDNTVSRVTNIGNYSNGDAVRIMVSTDSQPFQGFNIGLGDLTRQVGGRMSDNTLAEISRHFAQ